MKNNKHIKSVAKCLATLFTVASLLLVGANAYAEDPYPSRTVKIVVPYAPGGAADLYARTMAKHLEDAMGEPFIVENRPGASQMIGAMTVARAPADGYTLFLGATGSLAVNAYTQSKNIQYDPVKDFAGVSLGMTVPLFMVATPSLPVKNIKELIALLKANPGKYSYASIGVGSSTHVAMEAFLRKTGTEMLHVPFKSSVPAINAMLSGTVDLNLDVGSTSIPLIKAGKLHALGVGSSTRFPRMPDLPTIAEAADLPEYEATVWFGIVAPAETPAPILDKLSAGITKISHLPEVEDKFLSLGLMLTPTTPGEFETMIKSELSRWGMELRMAGVQPE